MRLLLIVFVLLAGCKPQLAKVDYDYERAHAAVTLGKYVSLPDVEPGPRPEPTPAPSGKCENCNGTGKIGDGRVFVPCPVCGGDGITQASKSPNSYWSSNGNLFQNVVYIDEPKQEEPTRTEQDSTDNNPDVVVYTASWCEPCTRWKLNVLPKLIDEGRKVLLRKPAEGMRIPHFRFFVEGQTVEHTGYLSYEETSRKLGSK
jgi:hypothetical protein